jgi:hypothetical protein
VGKVFGKLAGITGWFVGFVREVSRGIAVGRLRSGTASQWDAGGTGRSSSTVERFAARPRFIGTQVAGSGSPAGWRV